MMWKVNMMERRVYFKAMEDFCEMEQVPHDRGEEEQHTATVPCVEAERKVTLKKVLVIFCVFLLATFISLSVYYFISLNHKEQDLEELRNANYILTSNYSALLEAHATLQSLYSSLKEKDDEFSNLKEFYCGVTNTTHENTCPVCKLGWVRLKSKCYFLSIDILNWTDSRDSCKKMDGQLVTIESLEEQDFLTYHADAIKFRGKYYWIDRYNISKENPTTRMDVEPGKSKRARDDNKEDCWEIDFFKKVASNIRCNMHLRWICESAVFNI